MLFTTAVDIINTLAAAQSAGQLKREFHRYLKPAVLVVDEIAQLFQEGAIRPPEIKLYRLSEAADAHRLSESRHFRGKLVFQVR